MIRYVAIAGFLLLAGCSKQPETIVSPAGEHAPKTPHGGLPIDLGDYNLEAVVDAPGGKIDLYVLDDDLENFIRIAQTQITATLTDKDSTTSVTFTAVANPATGETLGDTSYFATSSDWLKTHPHFNGSIDKVVIRSSAFQHIIFNDPP